VPRRRLRPRRRSAPCDWDDPAAREQLVDELVRDANAVQAALERDQLEGAAGEAVELSALIAG
jgi:hypothetical protein